MTSKRKKKNEERKAKKEGREGEKAKSKSQDCCVTFKPKNYLEILLSAHARTSQADMLHLDQKAAKCTTCKPRNPVRNPSSGWISIKKSKSGFHGFPFYRSIGKSKQGFAKLFSWTAVFFLLIMCAHARPLFLGTVFQILFRDFPIAWNKGNPKTDISALKSTFGFRVWLQIWNPDFKI